MVIMISLAFSLEVYSRPCNKKKWFSSISKFEESRDQTSGKLRYPEACGVEFHKRRELCRKSAP